MSSVSRKYANYGAHERPTVGDMKMSGVNVDHIGWLLCDGRELSVATYYYLHQVIGYSFGGSDLSFNLPNASGRVPGMIGQSVGKDWAMGDLSGEEQHTLVLGEIPSHNHTKTGSTTNGSDGVTSSNGDHSHTTNANPPFSGLAQRTGSNTLTTSDSTASELDLVNAGALTINSNGAHTHNIASNGGNQPHNNMQPTIFLGNMFIYCGKNYVGVFPSTRGQIIF